MTTKSVQESLTGEEMQLISHVFKKMHDDSVRSAAMRQLNFIHHPHLYSETLTQEVTSDSEVKFDAIKWKQHETPTLVVEKVNSKTSNGAETITKKAVPKFDAKFFL